MEKLQNLNWAVAKVLAGLRKKAGLSQEQLAGLAGLSEAYISAMERGLQCGSLTSMVHLAAALRINLLDLVKSIESEMNGNPQPPSRKRGKPKRYDC